MFCLCLNIIRNSINNNALLSSILSKKIIELNPAAIHADKEDKDDILDIPNTIDQAIIATEKIDGFKQSNTPAAVATPLPPLNRSHTGYMCPITAAIAAKFIMLGSYKRAMYTAMTPLEKSSKRVSKPKSLPPTRSKLVAPIFPDPEERTSMPLNFPIKRPNGMLPNM